MTLGKSRFPLWRRDGDKVHSPACFLLGSNRPEKKKWYYSYYIRGFLFYFLGGKALAMVVRGTLFLASGFGSSFSSGFETLAANTAGSSSLLRKIHKSKAWDERFFYLGLLEDEAEVRCLSIHGLYSQLLGFSFYRLLLQCILKQETTRRSSVLKKNGFYF